MRLSEEIKEHLENYKIEDLYLKNIADKAKNEIVWDGLGSAWDKLSVSTTNETKINFISKVYNCDFKYILDLCEKYKNAINSGTIKENSGGLTLNKTSVKAWLKKEDTKEYFNISSTFTFGRCKKMDFILTNRRTEEDIIREKFRGAISNRYYKEVQYFNTHDVYKVEENKYIKNTDKYGSLGLDVIISSEGVFLGKDEKTAFDINRKFTIDELKHLNNKYESITKYIDSLSEEVKNDISYDKKDIEEVQDNEICLD